MAIKKAAALTAARAGVTVASSDGNKTAHPQYSIVPHNLSKPLRRLEPKAGALVKLDIVESRLAAARAAGDDDRWSRYYLVWVRLHKVAFGYEQGASNG